jgi:hypothetical protein
MTGIQYRCGELALETALRAEPRSQPWHVALLVKVCLGSTQTLEEARDVLENLSEPESVITSAITLLGELEAKARSR